MIDRSRTPSPLGAAARLWSHPVGLLWLSVVAAIVFPFTLVGIVACQSHQAVVAEVEMAARRAVATTAEHTLKVLETHGLALDLADEITRGLSCDEVKASATLPVLLARISPPLQTPEAVPGREVNSVWVIGADGFICGQTGGYKQDNRSRAGRDYFAGARDAKDHGTFIGRTLIGWYKPNPFFALSRRRSAPADEFTGIVICSVDTLYLMRAWETMAPLSSGHRITLYRADGAALAPATPEAPPDPEAERRVAARWAAAAEGAAAAASAAAPDGVVFAWKVLPGWGVVITDTLDRAGVLHAWRRTVLFNLLVATAGSAALVGFALAVRGAIRRAEVAARRAEAEMKQRLQVEAALRQAQKMEALGQLTGGVAHDFNNLLMAVLGNLDLLRRRLSPQDAAARRLLDNAMRGAERGAALTRRMLAFARRQELQPQATDVVALLGGMEDLLQRSLGPQVRIDTAFAAGLAPAWVDPNLLELAIVNLATNARDAMPRGGRVTLAARMRTAGGGEVEGLAPGEYLCLAVSDTGEGMDAATLARAVEPFFTTKPSGRGTGLGLAMVHGFVHQSGGALVLRSRPGEGTTAELWLPRAAVVAVAAATLRESGNDGEPCCVLLVDDDDLVRAATADLLEDLGHVVLTAESGQQALELLRREAGIEVVITDQAMPGMIGTDLAEAIAALRPDLPVILSTGYTDLPADIRLFLLLKPYNRETLVNALRDARRRPVHASD